MKWLWQAVAMVAVVVVLAAGCGGRSAARDGAVVKLVLISPHSENIQQEFTAAFSEHHAAAYGSRVEIEWRDVGGGTSAIVQYLRNVYRRAETADIDILWGGGEEPFTALAEEGVFQPLALAADGPVLAAIPERFGGVRLRDEQLRWCGSAISGFGFLYNRQLLALRKLPIPRQWEDLGRPEMFGLVALADPTQSGSAAAAYEMIVQTEAEWPAGWAKLLKVLANANRFYDSAGDAANAPVLGEAMVATSIDFYGAVRVKGSPETLVYLSPSGQTAYSPDPIAILKNPPHGELAQRFVDFVLSPAGQALWAVRPGELGGPQRYDLGRQPIRTDVYELYAGRMSPWIANPYQAGHEMVVDLEMKMLRAEVLKLLVRCAAVDNLAGLKAARRQLVEAGEPAVLLAQFVALPAEVATREGLAEVAKRLSLPAEAERIGSAWQSFFRDKYRSIVKGE